MFRPFCFLEPVGSVPTCCTEHSDSRQVEKRKRRRENYPSSFLELVGSVPTCCTEHSDSQQVRKKDGGENYPSSFLELVGGLGPPTC